MKTNHFRSFKARQDFRPGYRVVNAESYKKSANRCLRANKKKMLKLLVAGIDYDHIIFANLKEVEDYWFWNG